MKKRNNQKYINMKRRTDGKLILTPREKFILQEAMAVEARNYHPELPAFLQPQANAVIHDLIRYASMMKDTDPSNATDAIYLALEHFGSIDNIEIHITPPLLEPVPDPTRP